MVRNVDEWEKRMVGKAREDRKEERKEEKWSWGEWEERVKDTGWMG